MGDFNVESYNGFLKEFCHLYNLKNLIKVPTCFTEYHQYILSLLSSRNLTRSGFDTFTIKCKDAFDIRVPIKHKYLRSNQSPFYE